MLIRGRRDTEISVLEWSTEYWQFSRWSGVEYRVLGELLEWSTEILEWSTEYWQTFEYSGVLKK